MTEPAEQLRLACIHARERFADALEQAGFRPVPGRTDVLVGYLDTADLSVGEATAASVSCPVEVTIPDGFPYSRPSVRPVMDAELEPIHVKRPASPLYEPSWGWHRERTGAFCLYVDDDTSGLPWVDATAFLQHATSWLDQDSLGWPDDDGALDLERYLPTAGDRRLVLYTSDEVEPGQHLKLKSGRNHTRRVGGQAARSRKGGRKSAWRWAPGTVRVVDLGELSAPIRSWDALLEHVDEQTAESLINDRRKGLDHVALRYTRRGEVGVVIAALTRPDAGGLATLNAAPADERTRRLRGHPESDTLAFKSVAVVGLGAIGAIVADLLHRHGVGRLLLLDPDILKPGNTRRHLLGDDYIGLNKATGVARFLKSARPDSPTRIESIEAGVTNLSEAIDVLEAVDIVIDATADSRATSLLTAVARAGTGRLVSAAVLADGYAARVDVIPHPQGIELAEAPALPQPKGGSQETGCSSPVSTTPPAAAAEAAVIAARVTTDLLLGHVPEAATEQRILSR